MTKHIQMSGVITGGMRVARMVAVLIAGLALTACSDLFLTECEKKNTAEVSFTNSTGGTAWLYPDWDGVNLGTIADGVTSAAYTVSAGPHLLTFKDATTAAVVCVTTTVSPAQCAAAKYTCPG